MYYRHVNLGAARPGTIPGGWPAMVLGALGLMAALLLGLFFFAFFLGVALVAGLALAARGWWLARKGARPGRFPDGRDGHDGVPEHLRGGSGGGDRGGLGVLIVIGGAYGPQVPPLFPCPKLVSFCINRKHVISESVPVVISESVPVVISESVPVVKS